MTAIDLTRLLNRLEEMESRLAQMYDTLRDSFRSDTDAAGFFYRMNMDEIAHRDVIRFEKRLVRNSRLSFDNVTVALGNIDAILQMAASVSRPGVTLDEALMTCMEIDMNPAAVYYITALGQVSPDISAMLGNIGTQYAEHVKEMAKYLKSRGVELPEGRALSLAELGMEDVLNAPETEAVTQPEAVLEPEPVAKAEEPAAVTPVARKCHVLIVEDNVNTRKYLYEILCGAGHHVDIATDGIEATEVLINSQFPFDLVISDINMPNMDGFKLMELINQRRMDIPFIILTSRTADEDVVRARNLGAVDYIRKPIRPEVVLFSINSFFYGKAPAAV